jgi:hypothetical protein
MWFGFGQTFARNYAKAESALEYSPLLKEWKDNSISLLKPTQTDGCVDEWWYNKTAGISAFDANKIKEILEPTSSGEST